MADIFSGLITVRPARTLGAIQAQCTLEERHQDDLVITDHPVEQGAQITDHAYKRPAEVSLRYGWNGAGLAQLVGSINPLQPDLPNGDSIVDTYQKLLELQASRIPFEILTGKRRYSNMLIKSLATTTDEKTENVLFINATCREVLIVQTQATTLPPKTSQKTPKKTAGTSKAGLKQLKPATPSPGGSVPIPP